MARIDATLARATSKLSGSSTARLDAELLLSYVIDKPRSYFFTWPEQPLSSEQLHDYHQLIRKRQQGTPIAYLTGEREFWNLRLKVNEATLIPRPDTELLVELALAQLLPDQKQPDQKQPDQSQARVVDLGTGTGAIALALGYERPRWHIIAIDKSPDALTVARENALINNVNNVNFLEGSWCEPLGHQLVERELLDMIVSNPPYIRSDDVHLRQGDVRFEPLTALTSGIDGLDDIRLIARQSFPLLRQKGWLLIEHGYDQGPAVRSILESNGFSQARTATDLSKQDRVTLAQKNSSEK